jgi:anti-anti-sigma regulatory factor
MTTMAKKRTASPRKTAQTALPGNPADDPTEELPGLPPVARPAGVIDLGASCTLADVAGLRSACLAALDGKAEPVIDGSRVARVDTAGLQVLVGFTIDCMERSTNFRWTGRSPELTRGIRLLGVDALLDSPGAAASPMEGVA